ncbi:MAG: hypothetical protein AAB785_02340 [Patescibacteria group bacterium]
MIKKVTVIYLGEFGGEFRANLEGTDCWGGGTTIESAIGALVMAAFREFGLEIDYNTEHATQLPQLPLPNE